MPERHGDQGPREGRRGGGLAVARRRRTPTPKEAVALQRELAAQVVAADDFAPGRDATERIRALATVAGVDVSIRGGRAYAAVVVLAWPSLDELEVATAVRPVEFPYVPGLLGFRELPVVADAFERLREAPELALVDGHGLAHPRRFGVACHVGVALDLPAVGCAKSRLCGEHREPGPRRGARTRLVDRGERVGTVLRTRDRVRPIYVSVGHRVALATAERLVLRAGRGYRLPEPTRRADAAAGRIRG